MWTDDSTTGESSPHAAAGVGVWTLTSRRLREIGTLELVGLSEGAMTLGSDDADVLLDWPGVAARHVLLVASGEQLDIEVLSAKTWVNDGPVSPGRTVALREGDKLTVGPIELHIDRELVESPNESQDTPADTAEWIERAEVQSELRRQLDEVEQAAEEQQRRLEEAEAAVEKAIEEAGQDPGGRDLEADLDRYRGLIDELKLSLVATTGEALEAHRQRLTDLQTRQAELDELRTRIRNRSGVLEERERRLEDRENAVARSDSEVRRREEALEQTAEELSEQGRQLDDREQSLWRRERDLERQESDLSRHETTWQTRLAEVQSQQLDLDRQLATTAEQHTSLTEQLDALSERETTVREREETVERTERELESREGQLGQRSATVQEERDSLREERDALATERTRLEGVRQEIDELRTSLDTRQSELDDRETTLAQQTAEADQEAHRFGEDMVRRSEEIESREAGLQEREVAVRNRELALELEREEFVTASESQATSTHELDARASQLAEREAELLQSKTHADDQLAAATKLREEAEQVRGELSANESELSALRTSLESTRSELDQREADLARAEAELATERERLERLSVEHTDVQSPAADGTLGSGIVGAVAGAIAGAALTSGGDADATLSDDASNDAASLDAESEELEQLRVELEQLRAEISTDRDTITTERTELDEERAEWREKRLEWESDQAAVQAAWDEIESARAVVADQQHQLLAEREELDAQRDPSAPEGMAIENQAVIESIRADVELEQAELQAERTRLEEWARELETKALELAPPSGQPATDSVLDNSDVADPAVASDPFGEEPSDDHAPGNTSASSSDEQSAERDLIAEWTSRTTQPISSMGTALASDFESDEGVEPSAAETETDAAVAEPTTGDLFVDAPSATPENESPFDTAMTRPMTSEVDPFADTPTPTAETPTTDEFIASTDDLFADDTPPASDATDLFGDVVTPATSGAHDPFDTPTAEGAPNPTDAFLDDAQPSPTSVDDLFDDASTGHEAAAASDVPTTDDPFGWNADSETPSTQDNGDDPFAAPFDKPAADDSVSEPQAGHSSADPFATTQLMPPSIPESNDPFGSDAADTSSPDASSLDTPPPVPPSEPAAADPFGDAPVSDSAPAGTDSELGIRSQLAEMFGVSMTELSEAAHRDDEDAASHDVTSAEATPNVDVPAFEETATPPEMSVSDLFGDAPAPEQQLTEQQPAEPPVAAPDPFAATLEPFVTESPSESDPFAATPSAPLTPPEEPLAIDPSTIESIAPTIDSVDESTPSDEGSEPQADAWEALKASMMQTPGVAPTEPPVAAAPPVAPEPPPVPTPTAPEPTADSSEGEEDSVAAYMERLLARSRGDSADEQAAPVAVTETPIPEPEAAPVEPPQPPKERTPVDTRKIRKEVVSFREVALMSARSAVAKSRVKQIRMQLIAKACAFGVGVIVTAVLLLSPLWSKESYVLFGVAAMLITGAMGYFLLESIKTYQGILDVGTREDEEDDAED